MPEIKGLFWDVGGVLLSNAWDHTQRQQAIEKFGLEREEFSERHELVFSSFERGKISLDEYLDRTVFYRVQPFTRDEFKNYMYSLSTPDGAALAFAKELADSGRYLMGTINNESRELNCVSHREIRLAIDFSDLCQFMLCRVAQAGGRDIQAHARRHATGSRAVLLH